MIESDARLCWFCDSYLSPKCLIKFLIHYKHPEKFFKGKKLRNNTKLGIGQKRKKAGICELFVLTSDSSEFSIFADFVGGPSANGVAVDVDNGFLPHVHPDDGTILGPLVTASLSINQVYLNISKKLLILNLPSRVPFRNHPWWVDHSRRFCSQEPSWSWGLLQLCRATFGSSQSGPTWPQPCEPRGWAWLLQASWSLFEKTKSLLTLQTSQWKRGAKRRGDEQSV